MSKKISSFSDYSAFAHGVVRVSGEKLMISASGLLTLFARASGFESSQAFKASFDEVPRQPESLRDRISARLRVLVSDFFFSKADASVQVRVELMKLLTNDALRRGHLWVSALYGNGLDREFIEEAVACPTDEAVLGYVVKIHGDAAYSKICVGRSDFHKMSFVDGVLYRVQKGSWEIAFSNMLTDVVVELDVKFKFSNAEFRKEFMASLDGQTQPEALVNNPVFRRVVDEILAECQVEDYLD
ncbi:MAG: hypothetical protein RSG77_21555 [Hafnia sp.]